MANVWETRNRLLLEQLEQLAERLSDEESIESIEVDEQILRLLVGVIILLRQHCVNKRNQCKHCGPMRGAWWLWHRQSQCTVYRSLDFAMRQPLRWVRWQLSHGAEAGDGFGG